LRKAATQGAPAPLPLADAETEDEEPKTEEGGESAYMGGLSDEYRAFSRMVNNRVPTALRDLFVLKPTDAVTPVEETMPALELVRNHFKGAAMSHGALTRNSHQDIAAALNELGGYSNSGEGGESRHRNDVPPRAWGPFWERVMAERAADLEQLTLDGDVRK